MTRKVKEWIGRTDDSAPPDYVRLRIFKNAGGICHICGGGIVFKQWDADHVVEIWDGGENRESNIRPAHKPCHRAKTKLGAAQRAEGKRHRAKQAGIKKTPRNPLPGSKASGWKKTFGNGWVRR